MKPQLLPINVSWTVYASKLIIQRWQRVSWSQILPLKETGLNSFEQVCVQLFNCLLNPILLIMTIKKNTFQVDFSLTFLQYWKSLKLWNCPSFFTSWYYFIGYIIFNVNYPSYLPLTAGSVKDLAYFNKKYRQSRWLDFLFSYWSRPTVIYYILDVKLSLLASLTVLFIKHCV